MPYSGIADEKLPSYIKNKSDVLKKKWITIFNAVYESSGEEAAFIAANSWLKRSINEKVVTARTLSSRERIIFKISDNQLLKRTDDGEEYLTAVLATTDEHLDGKKFSSELLSRWATKINAGKTIVGDFDHELYDALMDNNVPDTAFEELLKTKKGVAKAIKANYEKGKLYVKLLIDKRYRTKILQSKGLSVEAMVNPGDSKTDGELLGFTFGINQQVAVPNTGIVI
jgi:hypothetical protein